MALSDLTDVEWFSRLNYRRASQIAMSRAWWQYYDLEQPMSYVARILLEQDYRFPPLMIAWPELAIDSLEERLDVEGFRLRGKDSSVDELDRVWQANDLDEDSEESHLTSLVTSRSYIMVGPGEGDTPLVTVEYPDQVAVEIDPRTRQVVAALKVWRSDENAFLEDRAVLYLPGRMVEFEYGKPVGSEESPAWASGVEHSQNSPLVPVIPMLNRPRRGHGRSELVAMKPLVDAANQTATNMLAAIEHHSLPRKWAVGVSEDDFKDAEGNPIPRWQIATGAVWAVPHQPVERGEEAQEVKLGQFSASDLRNFHDSIKQLAQLAGSLYGLPPHYMGYTSENPASAEAIKSSESRLVKRAERRQRTFGGAWERAMRIAWAMMGNDPSEANELETVWRDPSTPTRAQKVDAAAKAIESGLADVEQARIDAGYTLTQRESMRERESSTDRFQSVAQGLRRIDVQSGLGVEQVNGVPAARGQ